VSDSSKQSLLVSLGRETSRGFEEDLAAISSVLQNHCFRFIIGKHDIRGGGHALLAELIVEYPSETFSAGHGGEIRRLGGCSIVRMEEITAREHNVRPGLKLFIDFQTTFLAPRAPTYHSLLFSPSPAGSSTCSRDITVQRIPACARLPRAGIHP